MEGTWPLHGPRTVTSLCMEKAALSEGRALMSMTPVVCVVPSHVRKTLYLVVDVAVKRIAWRVGGAEEGE